MKHIKLFLTIVAACLTFSNSIFADNCPTVIQVWQGVFNGWDVDIWNRGHNSFRPATTKEITELESDQHIVFGSAYWNNGGKTPMSASCFYAGSIALPLSDQYVLLKSESQPSGGNWQTMGTQPYTTMMCTAVNDVYSCAFPSTIKKS